MRTVTDEQREAVVLRAQHLGFMHIPYEFGGSTTKGMDCSGLTQDAWEHGRIELPHNASQQALWFDGENKLIPWSAKNAKRLEPGDLLFYAGEGGKTPKTLKHVGIFLYNFQGMHIIAQATDTEHGSEVIRAEKYEPVLFIGLTH